MNRGSKIELKNGQLNVPNNPTIPFIQGDGTGPELIKVTSDLLNEFIPNSVELIFCEAGLETPPPPPSIVNEEL